MYSTPPASSNLLVRHTAYYNFHNLTPNATYDVLAGCSGEVAMWETVYYHVVPSHSAVIDWYKGSGLKPYLDALGENESSSANSWKL